MCKIQSFLKSTKIHNIKRNFIKFEKLTHSNEMFCSLLNARVNLTLVFAMCIQHVQ